MNIRYLTLRVQFHSFLSKGQIKRCSHKIQMLKLPMCGVVHIQQLILSNNLAPRNILDSEVEEVQRNTTVVSYIAMFYRCSNGTGPDFTTRPHPSESTKPEKN